MLLPEDAPLNLQDLSVKRLGLLAAGLSRVRSRQPAHRGQSYEMVLSENTPGDLQCLPASRLGHVVTPLPEVGAI